MSYSALVTPIQLTLVAMLLLLLAYGYRHLLGKAALYILSGTYYIFVLLSSAVESGSVTESTGYTPSGNCVLWLPFLVVLLGIYELEGTITAQRFFLGLIAAPFFILLLPTLANPSMNVELYGIIGQRQGFGVLIGALVHLAFFILAPLLYQAVSNRLAPRTGGRLVCLLVTLATFLAYSEAFVAIHTWTERGTRGYLPPDASTWGLRLLTAASISLLGWAFISINDAQLHRPERPFFSFVGGFLRHFFSTEQAMQSLDEWSERYQIVVDNSSEIILLTTAEGEVLNANPMAIQYLGGQLKRPGFKLEDVIFDADGEPWNWRAVVPDGDIHATATPVQAIRHYTGLFLRQEGRPAVDLDVSVSRTLFEGHSIAVIVARDVTLRNREEQRIRDEQEKRMHSQRLEALGELAGGIAHDFNNLMQSVQASVDALKTRIYDHRHSTEDNLAMLGNVDEACKRATRLTSQLLGFAHKGKFHAEDITVKELLEHAMALFKVGAGGIDCKLLCEPAPLMLNCDEIQMGQMLLNLMLNARDALEGIPEPRIVLRAEHATAAMPGWEKRPEEFAAGAPSEYVCIHVRDNGCGMSEEVKARIFDPFFTTKPVGKGTGMGLPMAFGCVSNHKGWLHVRTAPGKGCDIAIFLPLLKAA